MFNVSSFVSVFLKIIEKKCKISAMRNKEIVLGTAEIFCEQKSKD